MGDSLSKPTKDLTMLEKKEADLARQNQHLLFAGAAFLTFGAFMAKALGGLLDQSSKGAIMLDDLGLAWGRFTSRLSASVAHTLEGQAKWLIGFLDSLSSNQGGIENLAFIGSYATEATLALGALFISVSGLKTALGLLGGGFAALKLGLFMLGDLNALGFGLGLKIAALLGLPGMGIVLPITVTLALSKVLFDSTFNPNADIWKSPAFTQKPTMPTDLGGWIGAARGMTPTGGNPITANITNNIYGNTWDHSVDEDRLADKVGNKTMDALRGTVGVR